MHGVHLLFPLGNMPSQVTVSYFTGLLSSALNYGMRIASEGILLFFCKSGKRSGFDFTLFSIFTRSIMRARNRLSRKLSSMTLNNRG
jgi:hypothetical protein